MRGAFGLVGLLVTVGVLVYVFSRTTSTTVREGEKARHQAEQISGRGPDGESAINSFKTEAQVRGGQVDSLLVTDVTAGGALEHYGLQKGDRITGVNGSPLATFGNDGELAKTMVHDAYSKSQPITVIRNGQNVTLPAAAPAGGAAQGATPPQPGNPQSQAQDITKQLQNLGR